MQQLFIYATLTINNNSNNTHEVVYWNVYISYIWYKNAKKEGRKNMRSSQERQKKIIIKTTATTTKA